MKNFDDFIEYYYEKNTYLPNDKEDTRIYKDMMLEMLRTYHEWLEKKTNN